MVTVRGFTSASSISTYSALKLLSPEARTEVPWGANCGFISLQVNSSGGSWPKDADKSLKWEVVQDPLCLVKGGWWTDQLIVDSKGKRLHFHTD